MADLRKRPKRLTRLRVHEASLVSAPANPHATVLLWKSANGGSAVAKSLAAEIAAIEREEAPAEQLALMAEAIEWAMKPEMQEIEMRTTSELDRMLAYARAGGQVHSWSDTDVAEAMDELAAEIVPDAATPEQALAKSFSDRRMTALYELYRNAERAPVEEPVEKARQKGEAEAEIGRLAEAMAEKTGWTVARCVDRIVSERPALYARYRRELAAAIAGAGSALVR